MICPVENCQTENDDSATSCKKCGQKFAPAGKRKGNSAVKETQANKDTKTEVVIAVAKTPQVDWGSGSEGWWEAKDADVVYLNTDKVFCKDKSEVIRPIVAVAKIVPRSVGARGDVPRPMALLAPDKVTGARGTAKTPSGNFGALTIPYFGDEEQKLHLWSPELYRMESTETSTEEEEEEQKALKALEKEDELQSEKEDKEAEEQEKKEAESKEVENKDEKFILDLSQKDKVFDKSPAVKVEVKAETDMDQMCTALDKGHLFALALGGIDHSAQIVPQVRTCNRGTWLRMETRIASSNWRERGKKKLAEVKLQEAQQKMSVDSKEETRDANLETKNTLSTETAVIGRIYLFYHKQTARDYDWDKLIRIPAWFYFQIYYIAEGRTIGIGHYSMGNGRPVNGLRPTEEEITAFLRAHKALDYEDPRTPETQDRIAKGQWYPDPPYAALQWLSDQKDPVIRFRNFSAAGFAPDEIDIIRKYNWWLNGGACNPEMGVLRSDYRAIIRDRRRALVASDYEIMDKLLDGKDLEENEKRRLAELVAEQKREVEQIQKGDKPFPDMDNDLEDWVTCHKDPKTGVKFTWDEDVWNDAGTLDRAQKELAKTLASGQFNGAFLKERTDKKQLTSANATLTKRVAYLNRLEGPAERLSALEQMQKDGKAKGNAAAETCAREIQAERKDVALDLEIEQPDLYEELDLSGGRGFPEVDHIIPKNRNGWNRYDNARLVSFAQNHIYRDKVYLSESRTEKDKEKARQRCAANYEKEKERVKKRSDFLRQHALLVDEFRVNPDRRLLPMIRDFIKTWGVQLDDRSERPEAPPVKPVEVQAQAPQPLVIQIPQVQPVNNTANVN
jgi:hypothetical protein